MNTDVAVGGPLSAAVRAVLFVGVATTTHVVALSPGSFSGSDTTDVRRLSDFEYGRAPTSQTLRPEHARTPLGRRLLEIRQRIIASGVPLLDPAGIERLLQEGRGEQSGHGGP